MTFVDKLEAIREETKHFDWGYNVDEESYNFYWNDFYIFSVTDYALELPEEEDTCIDALKSICKILEQYDKSMKEKEI